MSVHHTAPNSHFPTKSLVSMCALGISKTTKVNPEWLRKYLDWASCNKHCHTTTNNMTIWTRKGNTYTPCSTARTTILRNQVRT